MWGIETIAELGINHNGSVNIGKQILDTVADAGFTSAKFQTYHPERRFDTGNPFVEIFRDYWLEPAAELELWTHASNLGLRVYTTPFDAESLSKMDLSLLSGLKIASFETTNLDLVRAVGREKKRTLISLGQNTRSNLLSAVRELTEAGVSQELIVLLHCISSYPTRAEDANLAVIGRLRAMWPGQIGYSDHTKDSLTAALALAAGARVFEKHVTIDCTLDGPDHGFSLDPSGMKTYIQTLTVADEAMGSDELEVRPSEQFIFENARRTSS